MHEFVLSDGVASEDVHFRSAGVVMLFDGKEGNNERTKSRIERI